MDDSEQMGVSESPPAVTAAPRGSSAAQDKATLRGTFSVLLLYDVAEELNLETLHALLHPNADRAQRTFRRRTPGYVQFEHPPVLERIGNIRLRSGEEVCAAIRYYSFGVTVVEYQVAFGCPWDCLASEASRWIEGGGLEEEGRELVLQRLAAVSAAIVKSSGAELSEHYLLITVEQPESNTPPVTAERLIAEHGREIAQVISGELAPLSDKFVDEVLARRLSYYATDLVVVGSLAAFVYDRVEDATAVGQILEYAKMQLLEFRYYDGLISRALANLYDVLEKERSVLFSRWTLSHDTEPFNTVRLDVMELTERIDNAIKFVSDVYYARLYREAASRMGVAEYRTLVDEKLSTARELSEVMVDQFNEARSFLLEVGVAILALLDVILLFRGK